MIKYFLTTAFLFLITYYSSSQVGRNVIYSYTRDDLKIILHDSTILDCTKFIPEAQTPDEKFPVIVFLHGLGGSKEDVIPYAEDYTRYGYYTFAYSMRGQGNSTGRSNLISSLEMKDLLHVISYIKEENIINPERIALMGSSQGGVLALMAACNGAGVRCIVADLSSPEFASSWLENGCIKMSLLWSVSMDSIQVRFNPGVKKFREWIFSNQRDKYDSLLSYLPKERDFGDKIDDLNCHVLLSNAWQDKYFNADDVLKASESIPQPFRLYFGAVQGHGSDTTGDENDYRSMSTTKWLEYWLYDIPDGINDTNKFIFASSVEPVNYHHWSYIRDSSIVFPPVNTNNLRLYFHPGSRLSFEPLEREDTVSFLNDVEDKSITMEEAVYREFSGGEFDKKFIKDYIYFETAPIDNDITLLGTPKVNIVYSSSANICQFNFQIWEVTPDGGMNFVTRINYTDRKCYPHTKKEKWIRGEASSHIFKKGNRIRVYVTNLDNGPYDSFLGKNPFVLPVLKRAKNLIYTGSSQATYLEMPVR
ncbi:MAG: alpha/beta fold hydrolase [Ignavibacteria bacterium]|jgi:predicted acyl esterase